MYYTVFLCQKTEEQRQCIGTPHCNPYSPTSELIRLASILLTGSELTNIDQGFYYRNGESCSHSKGTAQPPVLNKAMHLQFAFFEAKFLR